MRKIAISIALSTLLLAPSFSSALTTAELKANIEALLVQITATKAALTAGAASALPDDYGTGEGVSYYCPSLRTTFQRGATDARTGGQVTELQRFLADRYDLDEDVAVSGFFGKTTQRYVVQFQSENGLPALGIVGSLTRVAITRACGAFFEPTTHTAPVSISCGNGNDYYDGGDGTDTLSYTGKRSDFVATRNVNGSLTLRDTVACRADTDTIVSVELFQFSDGLYTLQELISGVTKTPTYVAPQQTPVISFSTSPMDIHAGQGVTLSWNAVYANRCVLKFGTTEIGGMPAQGTQVVHPTETTSYILWCVNEPGNGKDGPAASKTLYVNVRPAIPQDVSFAPNSHTTFTLVEGQTATDGANGIRLTLQAIAMDSLGYTTASVMLSPAGYAPSYYNARAGMPLTQGGGISDALSSTGSLIIDVTSINTAQGTVLFTVDPGQGKG